MSALEFSAQTAANHAPLVQRAAGIFAACGVGEVLRIGEAGDRAPVLVERGLTGGIVRQGGTTTLTYPDPNAESALAALIACATPAGLPIAADTESLSVLALAERLPATTRRTPIAASISMPASAAPTRCNWWRCATNT